MNKAYLLNQAREAIMSANAARIAAENDFNTASNLANDSEPNAADLTVSAYQGTNPLIVELSFAPGNYDCVIEIRNPDENHQWTNIQFNGTQPANLVIQNPRDTRTLVRLSNYTRQDEAFSGEVYFLIDHNDFLS